ncbi:component of SufBCD complex [Leisingera aquaemixtae]|uniref:component of SufBCD complex n=1 Tax=Leisingera TaxID=191028 RepID=UPI001C988BA0|nr:MULTISPECIES: component of SufBCD complex [Leisingera]MBY6065537.1 component of SufBCD complex [Leisingera aquaemixtae]MCB4454246.1 component of SufBCD complex [Leisingera sp. McT4-56]
MDLLHIIYEMIDLRSFSNLWYWISLAVMWSSASHWILGVPFDMVYRARRRGGQAEQDLEDITRVNVNRMLYIAEVSGPWLVALACFLLSALATLGFVYLLEIAQAVFLLAFPMSVVGLISFLTARRIAREGASGEDLRKRLSFCRLYIQFVGTVSILVTAFWGMYQNLTIGAL